MFFTISEYNGNLCKKNRLTLCICISINITLQLFIKELIPQQRQGIVPVQFYSSSKLFPLSV